MRLINTLLLLIMAVTGAAHARTPVPTDTEALSALLDEHIRALASSHTPDGSPIAGIQHDRPFYIPMGSLSIN